MQALTAKQTQEKSDLLLALGVLGKSPVSLTLGVPDPPDWWVAIDGQLVPVEITRALAEGSANPPMARLARWRKLRDRLRERQLAPELELQFRVGSDGAEVPYLKDIAAFVAAIETAVSGTEPVTAPLYLTPPAGTDRHLTALVARPCSLSGEVFGSPDAAFLSVVPESHLNDIISTKQAKLQAGNVTRAWLVIILGVELASEFLRVGELEFSLLRGPTDPAVLERVYVVDLASRAALAYQQGRWSAAA